MNPDHPRRLHAHINSILNLFLVNEKAFPPAQGRMRYSPLDFQTIRFVSAHPDCPAKAIADALGVAPTTQQSVLDRLVRKGFLERGKNPSDGRSKVYVLSEEGQELRAAIEAQDIANMEFILAPLSEGERESLLKMFAKVQARIEEVT